MAEAWFMRVKHVRNQLGLSQAVFAERLGVSDQTIAKWEIMAMRPYSRLAERFEYIEERVLSGEVRDPWEGLGEGVD